MRADDPPARFSHAVSAAETAEIGLAQLNSDELASLDALVRRDRAESDYVYKTPRPARFSARLTPEERQAAGLDRLTADQVVRLDAVVAANLPPPRTPISAAAVARATGGPADSVDTAGAVRPSLTLKRAPEIHGEISLMVGGGSGGFSEYGGALAVSYDDPAHGFSLLAAYSEVHTKGGYYLRDCRYGFDDPFLLP